METIFYHSCTFQVEVRIKIKEELPGRKPTKILKSDRPPLKVLVNHTNNFKLLNHGITAACSNPPPSIYQYLKVTQLPIHLYHNMNEHQPIHCNKMQICYYNRLITVCIGWWPLPSSSHFSPLIGLRPSFSANGHWLLITFYIVTYGKKCKVLNPKNPANIFTFKSAIGYSHGKKYSILFYFVIYYHHTF